MRIRLLFRLPAFAVMFFVCLYIFKPNDLIAQSEPSGTQVKITVNILALGINNNKLKGKNKPVWKFYNGDMYKGGQELTNYKMETCFSIKKSKKNNRSKELDEDKQELRSFMASISGFTLTMEGFVNTKGTEKCEADSKDKIKGIDIEELTLDKLAPNEWSAEVRMEDKFDRFWSVIKYKYTLTGGLNEIKSSSNEIINDVTKSIELSLPIQLPNKENILFTWKYSTGDDKWRTLPNVNQDKSSIRFNPLQDIFKGKLNSHEKVLFKAEAEINNKPVYSDERTFTFVSSPPDFDDKKDIKLSYCCTAAANGGIQINNIKTTAAEVKYVLRKKTDPATACSLEEPDNEDCPGFVTFGNVLRSEPIVINGLAIGEYTVYIFNADLASGVVNKAFQFTITEMPLFKIESKTSNDPTCENDRSGNIHIPVNGEAEIWQIAINPNKGELDWSKNDIRFKGLEGGKYTVSLTDKCGIELKQVFNLKKPEALIIESIKPNLQKEGYFARVFLKNGSGDYTVKVTDPNMNVTNPLVISDIDIPISEVGIYRIQVTDNKKPGCTPANKSVKVDKTKTKPAKFIIEVVD